MARRASLPAPCPATLLFFLLIVPNPALGADIFPRPGTVRRWASRLERALEHTARKGCGREVLEELYLEHRHLYDAKTIDPEELVKTVAARFDEVLQHKVKALERLAHAAEELERDYLWRGDTKEESQNLNQDQQVAKHETSTQMPQDGEVERTYELDPVFGTYVDKNRSTVQIPTDIYKGSAIMVNERNWTAGLDETFKRNKEEDPTLLWQVFGSVTGLLRFFPGQEWVSSGVDLYDLRRRPWYIQGVCSPKDMVILMDVSGSVTGLTLKLMKSSVSELLKTLADNDFVNIAFFNKEAKPVSCFKHLVQANEHNKKVLLTSMQQLTATGVTNYNAGFSFAFEQLLNTSYSRAECNKMIMLFTDGGEDQAEEVFRKYNSPNKTVRVFTFSVGQHNYNVGPVQQMACTNNGYYSAIPSIGAIRISTQNYLNVLGRPMVLAGPKAKKVQWTNMYKDALTESFVITGTLPVFNISYDQNKQNQLLGVMAIDVSLEEINKLTPKYHLSPNGYFYAMDSNGYVIMHPSLNVENAPEPVTLDILDAELSSRIKVEIRRSMIDKESGTRRFETLIKSEDKRYVDKAMRIYTWIPISDSDYSLALVLPAYPSSYLQAHLTDQILQVRYLEQLLPTAGEDLGRVFIAPREYCKNLMMTKDNEQFLQNFMREMDKQTPDAKHCRTDLIYNLILDAGITAKFAQTHWPGVDSDSLGIINLFVATDGGVTRVLSYGAREPWLENPEPCEASYYKRSLNSRSYVYRAVLPPDENERGGNFSVGILVTRALNVSVGGRYIQPAVVGIRLNPESWISKLRSLASNLSEGRNLRQKCPRWNDCEMDCQSHSKILNCLIVDDGGFIILSNQDIEQTGIFLGESDPHLMQGLLDIGLFSRVQSYDYLAPCEPEPQPDAGAAHRSTYIPRIPDLLSLTWWLSATAWSMIQQLLYKLTLPSWYNTGLAVQAEDTAMMLDTGCMILQTQFYFTNSSKSFHREMICGNCSRVFHAEKLGSSNLVLVVAEQVPQGCPLCSNLPSLQILKKSKGPDQCQMAEEPRYRKGPELCFDYNTEEDVSECGDGTIMRPSLSILLILQLLLLWPAFTPLLQS
uniref:Calcium voltage-gated channel auxiliary subunit alpha2delta 2 n=1 Tax=Eptatretus burgeri TaxID=7764 RepID=A0A8C4WRS2_EPTBU